MAVDMKFGGNYFGWCQPVNPDWPRGARPIEGEDMCRGDLAPYRGIVICN